MRTPVGASVGVPAKGGFDAGHVAWVETVDRRQNQRGIVDRPADPADLVEGPAERHRTGTARSPKGGTQAHRAASGDGWLIVNAARPATVAAEEPAFDPLNPSPVFDGL